MGKMEKMEKELKWRKLEALENSWGSERGKSRERVKLKGSQIDFVVTSTVTCTFFDFVDFIPAYFSFLFYLINYFRLAMLHPKAIQVPLCPLMATATPALGVPWAPGGTSEGLERLGGGTLGLPWGVGGANTALSDE